jgi:hypothetical protein
MLNRRCKKNVLMRDGLFVCMATHPKMPNLSGHARGRKRHLTADRKSTVCNMLVDQLFDKNTERYQYSHSECKTCFRRAHA